MIRTGALLAAALVLASPAARAQTYPSRQITLIIPFAAGGSNDLVGRAIGKKLSEVWGQPVVVENRAGAGGLIGTAAVAKAAPDGYTLLLVSPTFTINPAIKKNMPFDTDQGFHAGRLHCPLAASGRRVEQAAGEIRQRIVRSRQEQAGPDHLRLGRSRQHQPDCGRADRAFGRRQIHARSLQGRRAGAQRSRRRPCRHLRLEPSAGAAARQKRPGQGACGDRAPSERRCCPTCRRLRRRAYRASICS